MTVFDERELKDQLFAQNAKDVYESIVQYDEEMVPIMKARGYTCIHSMERTVAFTFGEITFRRRRWKKGGEWVVPVDEKLGLSKNTRFSWEFMYQVACLSTMMPYDKVIQVIQLTYHIRITKPIVVKAVKLCDELLKEKATYRFYGDEEAQEKQPVNVIYIEGDGVMVKASDQEDPSRNYDLSHFVIHTGSKKVGSNRFELQGKKEFISLDNRLTRDQVLDYLYNHFDIKEETILITNSDGGHGYTPYIFKEIAKALKVKRHEHFWDAYHVNQKLKLAFRPYAEELLDLAFQAIKQHDKEKLRTVLDTTEGLLSTEEEEEEFEHFKNKLLQNFQYTKPANLRGLSSSGIGVMESQHRKVTYRMKKRGMYWTVLGAQTMSQMIILNYEDGLRELFFGCWREEYEEMMELDDITGGTIKVKQNKVKRCYRLPNFRYPSKRRLGKK